MSDKKPQTGNYETREELIQNVHHYFHREGMSHAAVAEKTGIKVETVKYFLKPAVKR